MTRKILSSRSRILRVYGLFVILSFAALSGSAASWYVNPSAKGANNGTSWSDAWTKLSFSGLTAGDTVYISGGPAGSSVTYDLSGEFTSIPGFTKGSPGKPVTYKIGQESAHNGTAVFRRIIQGSQWLFGGNDYIISGDAGDGKMHFKISNYQSGLALNGSSNVRVSYVDFDRMPTMGIINPGTKIEIDNCYIYISDLKADRALYAKSTGSAYDQTLFHHNTIYVPFTNDGIGADGLQFNGDGYSIYNNNIYGYRAAYTGGQHQDGQQATGPGSYIKIYNNLFVDLQNYPIYQEPQFGGYAHMRIYNNIMVDTSARGSQAIAAGGWMSPLRTLDDCIIANNIADGYAFPYTCRDPRNPTATGVFSNVHFYNNISVNGGSNLIDPNVSSANNVSLSAAQASSIFVSYTATSATNDYHLKSTATSLIGTGKNLSSYFVGDKDNSTRSSWDIGAYSSTSLTSGGGTAPPSNAKIAVITQ